MIPTASACYLVLAAVLGLWGLLVGLWLIRRLTARPCPVCRSRWATELVRADLGRGELWHCDACHYTWERKYR